MILQAFQHRSGRVIAVSRAILACFFTLAILLDPEADRADEAALLLVLYTVFAIGILLLTWNNWWREARLSPPAHILDLVVFTILVFLTEGYISPFFTFFVFLVLSAAIRWGWREALLTTSVVMLLYLGASYSATVSSGMEGFDLQRFVVRGANLVVVSLMIVWFGVNQAGARGTRGGRAVEEAAAAGPPVQQAMEFAAARLGARKLHFAWSESEEPWLHVWSLDDGVLSREQHGPDAFSRLVPEALAGQTFLFDVGERRRLHRSGARRRLSVDGHAIDPEFAARYDIHSGVAIPLAADGYDGWLFVSRVPGLCSDDLAVGAEVGAQISAAFERTARLDASQEAAATRSRLLLARDLHDSVVQFLAGMSLKIESLRRGARQAGADAINRELEELQLQLIHEQRDLRKLISTLREPQAALGTVSAAERLLLLGKRLERHWGVVCAVEVEPKTLSLPPQLQQELDLLVREAVANGVRHGAARHLVLTVSGSDGGLRLAIGDDGKGFPEQGDFDDDALRNWRHGPRSLYERVHSLGGTMRLSSVPHEGARVTIDLPLQKDPA